MTESSDIRPTPDEVEYDAEAQRFNLAVAGQVAFIDARSRRAGGVSFLHTEVPEELEGRGVGSALVRGSLDHARREAWTVLPFCPFVHAYIRRHPEYVDLVDPSYPGLSRLTE